jgi:hypothetical protein
MCESAGRLDTEVKIEGDLGGCGFEVWSACWGCGMWTFGFVCGYVVGVVEAAVERDGGSGAGFRRMVWRLCVRVRAARVRRMDVHCAVAEAWSVLAIIGGNYGVCLPGT